MLTLVEKRRLKSPPTDIKHIEDIIVISTYSNKLLFINQDLKKVKLILLRHNILSLAITEDSIILCGDADGRINQIDKDGTKHKSLRVSNGPICSLFYLQDIKTMIFNDEKKVAYYDRHIKHCMYGPICAVQCVDVYDKNIVLSISQLEYSIRIYNKEQNNHSVHMIQDSGEYPEVGCFISREYFMVGSQSGLVYLFSINKKYPVASHKIGDSITSMAYINENVFVGSFNGDLVILKIEEEVKEIYRTNLGGIINVIYGFEDNLLVGVGREPRLGRWAVVKEKNMIYKFKI
ncbi:U3 snoRNP-associated protein-like [Astathelohania contejeani]|uniref:U3 snoRNP-associated protein-like n=1 Tax=Astathelohania contejeani TaxID=164912 RepID=A0ABQ7HZB8_9MICR|nr:U3 snoRNP-associated protein-like [Thelohania contejeani]